MTSPIAVIDVETTGINPGRHDRIVELAAVVVQPGVGVIRQFETLLNPDRDIGPTSIHGLTAAHIRDAPTFRDVAPLFIDNIGDCSHLCGHNVRFDLMFVRSEFDRIGHPISDLPSICTMRLAGGGSLKQCCDDYGVAPPKRAHSALDDAIATAELLLVLLTEDPRLVQAIAASPPIAWPPMAQGSARPVTRAQVSGYANRSADYLDALLNATSRVPLQDLDHRAQIEYWNLLDRVLEDRLVAPNEGGQLIELAQQWGLCASDVLSLHDDYLRSLVAAAAIDKTVTEAELRDLERVAGLLGVSANRLKFMLDEELVKACDSRGQESRSSLENSLTGLSVCFTGECQCTLYGQLINRDQAAVLVSKHGLVFSESVTKRLDILVVSDPDSLSGKAKKARKYGIRIVHEPVFWRMLGLEVG